MIDSLRGTPNLSAAGTFRCIMPTDRLFCSECGASNEPDAGFCESCGHRLGDAYVEPDDAGEQEEAPSPRRKLSPKLLAAVAVVVLAGSAYAFRAPITAYLGSLGGNSTKPADSVFLRTYSSTTSRWPINPLARSS